MGFRGFVGFFLVDVNFFFFFWGGGRGRGGGYNDFIVFLFFCERCLKDVVKST